MRVPGRFATTVVAAALLAGCGGTPTPSVEPGTGGDDAAADAPADAGGDLAAGGGAAGSSPALGTPSCPPVLGADDPDPFGDGTSTAALSGDWFSELNAALSEDADVRRRTAGGYLDQDAGAFVVVAVGEDPDATVADLVEAHVPAEFQDAVGCRHGAVSMADLEAAQRVAMDAAGGPASGEIDVVRNLVRVWTESGDPEAVRTAVAEQRGLEVAAAVQVTVPDCAADADAEIPADAVALPGRGSNCGGMDALASGTLGGDPATGCLTLGTGDLEEPLAWPIGWYVTTDGTVHDHTGEPRAAIGDEVELGGGWTPVVDDGGACGWAEGGGGTAAEPGGAFLVNSVTVTSADR